MHEEIASRSGTETGGPSHRCGSSGSINSCSNSSNISISSSRSIISSSTSTFGKASSSSISSSNRISHAAFQLSIHFIKAPRLSESASIHTTPLRRKGVGGVDGGVARLGFDGGGHGAGKHFHARNPLAFRKVLQTTPRCLSLGFVSVFLCLCLCTSVIVYSCAPVCVSMCVCVQAPACVCVGTCACSCVSGVLSREDGVVRVKEGLELDEGSHVEEGSLGRVDERELAALVGSWKGVRCTVARRRVPWGSVLL